MKGSDAIEAECEGGVRGEWDVKKTRMAGMKVMMNIMRSWADFLSQWAC